MITVKDFERSNTAWKRRTPALEQFTRWANAKRRFYTSAVTSVPGLDRSDFIAEIGFSLSSASDLLNGDNFRLAVVDAQKRLANLPGHGDMTTPLIEEEKKQVLQIASNIQDYIRKYGRDAPQFRPKLSGCGVIIAAEADLVIGSRIVEVKSVNRNFRSSDFRQLITYVVLAYSQGIIFDKMVLLNPKMGFFFETSLEELAVSVGANSGIELVTNLQDDISNWLTVSG